MFLIGRKLCGKSKNKPPSILPWMGINHPQFVGLLLGLPFNALWYFGGTCAKMIRVAGHLRPEPAWNQAGCGWCGGHVHRCRVLCVPDEAPWNIHWRIRGVATWMRRTGGFQNFLLVYPYLQIDEDPCSGFKPSIRIAFIACKHA